MNQSTQPASMTNEAEEAFNYWGTLPMQEDDPECSPVGPMLFRLCTCKLTNLLFM